MAADGGNDSRHISVLMQEVIELLQLQQGDVVFDGTLGLGGHSSAICKKIFPGGRLIVTDRDMAAINIAKERLSDYLSDITIFNNPYSEIENILAECNLKAVDKVLLDIGVSSMQLDDAQRGFSFRFDAPLDMRMDRDAEISAEELISRTPETELADIIYKYGEERFSRRIAKRIVEERIKAPINTTGRLAEIVRRSVPGRSKIDKATRTFQALRIAVNQELEELEKFLDVIFDYMAPGGRIAIISFHSLEDRIVKNAFRDAGKFDDFKVITKKPVVASDEECELNPRSRSAKLRVVECIRGQE